MPLLITGGPEVSGMLSVNDATSRLAMITMIVIMLSVMITMVSIMIICRAGLVIFHPPETAR